MFKDYRRRTELTEIFWEFLEGHRMELNVNPHLGEILYSYELLSTAYPLLMNEIIKETLRKVNGAGTDDFRPHFQEAIQLISNGYSIGRYNLVNNTSLCPVKIKR